MALGISIGTLGVACGDDDGGDGVTGGSGGSGASGGSGGAGGDAGAGMTAGSSGAAGEGGAGGANGGTGGTPSGGASGAGAGQSGAAGDGSVETDAGPDGSVVPDPDSGVVEEDGGAAGSGSVPPVDSGINGDCDGFVTGPATIAPQNNQDVVIARVIFQPDNETAEVILRVTELTGFTFGDPMQLCWGGSDEECTLADDEVAGVRLVGTEVSFIIGSQDFPVDDDEGEVFFVSDFPTTGNGNPFAYVNWGDHDSADPDDAGPLGTLEGEADAANFWTAGDSIDLGTDNAFFGDGDTDVATGFSTCTADQF